MVPQRRVQPSTQAAAAHAGGGAVDNRGQCILCAAGDVDLDLEVAAAGGIEHDDIISVFYMQAGYVRQGGSLGVLCILHQAACCHHRAIHVFATKARQVPGTELAVEQPVSTVEVKPPWRLLTQADIVTQCIAELIEQCIIFRDEYLDRLQAFQFGK